ncbi:MAG: phosphomannomutase/phosphoglucomutase [Patescibacteria group bacterium]
MQVDPSIFKSYDIRGVYEENISDKTASAIGKAFVSVVKPEKVVVGRDGRVSGPALHKEIVKSLTDIGTDVIDIGMVSTDMYYYACAVKGLSGIMITASHNPKEYNGFKMVEKIPYFLTGDEGIAQIRKLIETDSLPQPTAKKGKVSQWNVMDEFIKKILSLVDTKTIKPMKVVADTGNGMVGPILEKLTKHLPQITIVPMYFKPDGTFPNHGGDPLLEENRRELQKRVVSEKADLGVAFDTDGDRFFSIDSKGRFVPGDFLTAILSQYFLMENPGAAIIYDIRASWVVPHTIEAMGGKALYNRVGHSYIKKRMIEENGLFGGEVSGHYYFKDFFLCDTGVGSMLYLMASLSQSGKALTQIMDTYEQTYFISGEINSTVEDIPAVLNRIEKKYGPNAVEVIKIDGITIINKDWKFNVRGSNTEPLIRLNLEATSRKLMEEKRDEVLAAIRGN